VYVRSVLKSGSVENRRIVEPDRHRIQDRQRATSPPPSIESADPLPHTFDSPHIAHPNLPKNKSQQSVITVITEDASSRPQRVRTAAPLIVQQDNSPSPRIQKQAVKITREVEARDAPADSVGERERHTSHPYESGVKKKDTSPRIQAAEQAVKVTREVGARRDDHSNDQDAERERRTSPPYKETPSRIQGGEHAVKITREVGARRADHGADQYEERGRHVSRPYKETPRIQDGEDTFLEIRDGEKTHYTEGEAGSKWSPLLELEPDEITVTEADRRRRARIDQEQRGGSWNE